MFDNLTHRLSGIVDRLKGRAVLTEADVQSALREVRVALLEADVALSVVKEFIQNIQTKAVGQDVLKSVSAGQLVIKIVHDELVSLLGTEIQNFEVKAAPPAVVMVVGLQGSGKTTMTGKLGNYLNQKQRRKVLMASLDIYRPAAQEQLAILGKQLNIATLPIHAGEKPLEITKRALVMAKQEGFDMLLLDTAGRLHIDQDLMAEVVAIKKYANPAETLLVVDAMTGQDAVNIAKEFNAQVDVTGIALTRLDGDARGGAALSMRVVTGKPIKCLGIGEKPQEFELFYPERIANRILGMGDVVTLVEKAMENINQDEMTKLATKMQSGVFGLDDLETQLLQMNKLGGMSGILNFLPGVGKLKDQLAQSKVDEGMIARQIAIIRSMTKKEKRNTKLFNGSRKRRVALGSGTSVQEVNRLLKQHRDMSEMMKRVKKMGKKGFLPQGMKGLFPGM